jgi:Kef-type K+ transport system membrane component KefB
VLLFAGICLCGLLTTEVGVNAIFGAFVLGVCLPRGSRRIELAAARLNGALAPVLLPLYFAVTGLSTDVGLLGGASLWLWFAAVLAVAVLGKFGGTLAAARSTGRSWRDSLTLGALMNCRGLTELIVLNTGLQLGILSPRLFTMLVLMALLTTAATAPALDLFGRVSRTPLPSPRALPIKEKETT